MNNDKVLIGILAIGLGLFGSGSVFGAKSPGQGAPASKQTFRPHAVDIPPAEPAGPAMPCREARRWSRMTTYTGCDITTVKQAKKAGQTSEDAKSFLRVSCACPCASPRSGRSESRQDQAWLTPHRDPFPADYR